MSVGQGGKAKKQGTPERAAPSQSWETMPSFTLLMKAASYLQVKDGEMEVISLPGESWGTELCLK